MPTTTNNIYYTTNNIYYTPRSWDFIWEFYYTPPTDEELLALLNEDFNPDEKEPV